MKYDYSISSLKKCISHLKINKNDIIYVTGDLLNFGRIKLKKLNNLPRLFFDNLTKKIGSGGTIVVPTHSFNLIKNNQIFDLRKTPSESGRFSTFILNKKKTIRQLHPFSSSAAFGKYAKYICTKNTTNVYGKNSPFERIIKKNAKFVSLGMKINLNCSQVHHAEYVMKVPYRYNKQFLHKIKINNRVIKKKFNLYVLREKFLNIKRNKNKKIIKNFRKKHKVDKQKLGLNYIYTYNLKDFYNENIQLIKKDKFCWLGKREGIH